MKKYPVTSSTGKEYEICIEKYYDMYKVELFEKVLLFKIFKINNPLKDWVQKNNQNFIDMAKDIVISYEKNMGIDKETKIIEAERWIEFDKWDGKV